MDPVMLKSTGLAAVSPGPRLSATTVRVRDGETLRGFYNICLHRAGPVAYGCGKRQTLQCKYHGWTYTLDGDRLTLTLWLSAAARTRGGDALKAGGIVFQLTRSRKT